MPKVLKVETQKKTEPVVPEVKEVESTSEKPILSDGDRENEKPKEIEKKPETIIVKKNGSRSISFDKKKD